MLNNSKLYIDDLPECDDTYRALRFRQEGFSGYLLELSNLPDFIEGLESAEKDTTLYFYQNFGFRKTSTTVSLHKSTKKEPLLHLSADQCAKLIAHLKSSYPEFL